MKLRSWSERNVALEKGYQSAALLNGVRCQVISATEEKAPKVKLSYSGFAKVCALHTNLCIISSTRATSS